MASKGYQIGIVGCGVAGQAAIFLAECGHDVAVFERFAEPWSLGAGLLLQPTGLEVLRASRPQQQALSPGAKVLGLEAKTANGRSVPDLSYVILQPKARGLGIRRGVLFDLLHRRLEESPTRLVTGTEVHDIVRERSMSKCSLRPPITSLRLGEPIAAPAARIVDVARTDAAASLPPPATSP